MLDDFKGYVEVNNVVFIEVEYFVFLFVLLLVYFVIFDYGCIFLGVKFLFKIFL